MYLLISDVKQKMKLRSIDYLRVYLYGVGHRSKYVIYTKSMNKDLYTMSKIEQEIKKTNPIGMLRCITINLLLRPKLYTTF